MAQSMAERSGQMEVDHPMANSLTTNQINAFSGILANDEAANENWLNLCTGLGTNVAKKITLKGKVKNDDTFPRRELFRELLIEWKSRVGSDATVDKLIGILEAAELNSCADAIRQNEMLPSVR